MLPAESNIRPPQDGKDVEFTRHVEVVRKEKKRKDSERSDESENKHKKKHKKDRKRDRRSKKRKDDSDDGELEAGEVVESHPLVTLTNIDPDEIPDQPANKFLMRGDPKRDNDRNKRRDSGNDRDRRYQRRQRGWGGDFYRRRKTKSGRIVKGRGQIHFRTPSRSRSRSITPVHWRKEEARVIKMSDLEKLDAERKRLETIKSVDGKERFISERRSISRDREQQSYTPKRKRNSNIDYNALDYEEPAYAEHEVKKQVPSLVQYPLPGAHNTFKTAEEVEEDMKKEEESQEEVAAINKRSDFLAMALGVQIKTGEDPPDKEIVLSGIAKQNRKFHSQHPGNINRSNQDRFPVSRFSDEGRFYRLPVNYQKEVLRNRTPPIPQIASKVEEKMSRNKFETEKKPAVVESQIVQRNGRFNDIRRGGGDRRLVDSESKGRYERVKDRKRGFGRQSRERRRSRSSSKSSKTRRRSRSQRKSHSPNRSPRSGSNNRSKKRSGSRKRSLSRSSRTPIRAKSVEKRMKKESESDKAKEDLIRIDKDAEEKYKKLLMLRKKMELLEFKKKKEEEQKLLEEKQRKAKEESEMLEKAKLAKREALEKQKLMKSYKVLQDLDEKKNITKRGRSSSSSSCDSDSSSSSSSSSSSGSSSSTSNPKKKDQDGSVKLKKKEERRSRSRSRRRSSEKKVKSRSRSPDRRHQRSYRK